MTPTDIKSRYDELCAGRAMVDLCPDETRELEGLCCDLGLPPDAEFDLLAATLEIEAVIASAETMPASLAARLHRWADQGSPHSVSQSHPVAQTPPSVLRPDVPAWRKFLTHPASGWFAAAAALVISLLLPRQVPTAPDTTAYSPAEAESRLRAQAPDLIERSFTGLGDFSTAAGKVIWSDARQEGYMILSGVPANDPNQAQYQLWIVDPKRDPDSPVDGGVFDIPAQGSPVIIPISAKLALRQPQAFVITLEQPGGVVKSKQEKVVALAKG